MDELVIGAIVILVMIVIRWKWWKRQTTLTPRDHANIQRRATRYRMKKYEGRTDEYIDAYLAKQDQVDAILEQARKELEQERRQ